MQASEKVVSPALDCSSAQPLMRWTIDDYHRLVDAGVIVNRRVELINGNLVEMAPEGAPHSHTINSGADHLRHHLSSQALIREAHPITLSASEPEPDIAIVKLPRSQYKTRHPFPADIFFLIEVSSSTLAYDLMVKKELYAKVGIREYWVADVVAQQIYVFRQLAADTYEEEIVFKSGNIQPLSFPAVSIRVNAFWD